MGQTPPSRIRNYGTNATITISAISVKFNIKPSECTVQLMYKPIRFKNKILQPMRADEYMWALTIKRDGSIEVNKIINRYCKRRGDTDIGCSVWVFSCYCNYNMELWSGIFNNNSINI
eukprot:212717_1